MSEITTQKVGLSRSKVRHPNTIHDREAIFAKLIIHISSGKSLPKAIEAIGGYPDINWAKHWIKKDPEIKARYDEAVKDRADALADRFTDMLDQEIPDHLEGSDRTAWVNHQRLRADGIKWLCAKFYPRMYGDRQTLEVNSTHISITAALGAADQRLKTMKWIDTPDIIELPSVEPLRTVEPPAEYSNAKGKKRKKKEEYPSWILP